MMPLVRFQNAPEESHDNPENCLQTRITYLLIEEEFSNARSKYDGSSFFVFEERVLDFDSVLKIWLFCWCWTVGVRVFGLTQKIPNVYAMKEYEVWNVAVFIVPLFHIRQSSLQASAYDIQRNDETILKKSRSFTLNNI
jgi:hypothetical protein